jgi:hypothetical protein
MLPNRQKPSIFSKLHNDPDMLLDTIDDAMINANCLQLLTISQKFENIYGTSL